MVLSGRHLFLSHTRERSPFPNLFRYPQTYKLSLLSTPLPKAPLSPIFFLIRIFLLFFCIALQFPHTNVSFIRLLLFIHPSCSTSIIKFSINGKSFLLSIVSSEFHLYTSLYRNFYFSQPLPAYRSPQPYLLYRRPPVRCQ